MTSTMLGRIPRPTRGRCGPIQISWTRFFWEGEDLKPLQKSYQISSPLLSAARDIVHHFECDAFGTISKRGDLYGNLKAAYDEVVKPRFCFAKCRSGDIIEFCGNPDALWLKLGPKLVGAGGGPREDVDIFDGKDFRIVGNVNDLAKESSNG